jgi:hypothetical protein
MRAIMSQKTATIFITKLGAAERQLNAAIRMVLENEDELAIHDVAASAYRVLRDIKQKRGRSDAFDLFQRGLFAIAEELATGKRNSIPTTVVSPLVEIIESIRDGIVAGDIHCFEDMPPIRVKNEGYFWYEFNKPFNFLKHAKQDSEDALDLAKLKNDELLMRASAVFVEITNRISPEIAAYYILIASHRDDSGLPEEVRLEFGNLPEHQKRKQCLTWLQKQRGLDSPGPA